MSFACCYGAFLCKLRVAKGVSTIPYPTCQSHTHYPKGNATRLFKGRLSYLSRDKRINKYGIVFCKVGVYQIHSLYFPGHVDLGFVWHAVVLLCALATILLHLPTLACGLLIHKNVWQTKQILRWRWRHSDVDT